MAKDKFPGPGNPSVGRMFEQTPGIVKVDQSAADWGGSKRSQPKKLRNSLNIKHVGGSLKGGSESGGQ